jgi:hypothetical protein
MNDPLPQVGRKSKKATGTNAYLSICGLQKPDVVDSALLFGAKYASSPILLRQAHVLKSFLFGDFFKKSPNKNDFKT